MLKLNIFIVSKMDLPHFQNKRLVYVKEIQITFRGKYLKNK